MLSKKYLAIKQTLTGVSKIKPLHRKLIVLANMYLDIEKGFRFSYIADENGETQFMEALSRHYKNGFTFFDVGAHVGSYTDAVLEYFKTYTGHLFDLSPATLEPCIKRHGSDKNLTINVMALTDSIGEVEYRYYPKTQMQTAISGVGPYIGHEFELRKAPASTGDHYCETKNVTHIDLLKIDTEGYDLHVLKGFDKTLSDKKIDVIQFEYNIKSGETHSMLCDFNAYLTEKGYVMGVLRPEGVVFKKFDFWQNDFNFGPNYIACLPQFKDMLSNFKAA